MKYLAILFVWLWGAAAHAQSVTILGGEHDGFSRLALAVAPNAQWSVQKAAGQTIVRVNGYRIDTSQAMLRLNNGRITSVSNVPPDAFMLRFNCDCRVEDSVIDGLLVVDVYDNTPALEFANPLPVIFDAKTTQQIPDFGPIAPGVDPQLVRAITRAADNGVLTLVGPNPDGTEADFQAQTVFTDFMSGYVETDTGETHECLPQTSMTPMMWGMTGNFALDLVTARLQIIPDLENIDQSGFADLTRVYLYYALFEEARRLSDQIPDEHPEKLFLTQFSRIDTPDVAQDYFRDLSVCSDLSSLLSVAATGMVSDPTPALRSISELPWTLREYLAPELAQAMIRAGEFDAAQSILLWTKEPDLLQARLHRAKGNLEAAHSVLLGSFTQTNIPVESVWEYLDLSNELNLPAYPETLSAAEVYLFDLRDTPVYADYAQTLALSYAVAGEFETAMDLYELDTETLQSVLSLLVDNAPDMVFLRLALAHGKRVVDPDLGDRILHRMGELGFAKRVAPHVFPVPSDPEKPIVLGAAVTLEAARTVLERSANSRANIQEALSQ